MFSNKRSAIIVVILLSLVVAACARPTDGTPTGRTAANWPGAGLLVAHPLNDDGTPDTTRFQMIDAEGAVMWTVEVPGDKKQARMLQDGRMLLQTNHADEEALVLVDTTVGHVIPVSWTVGSLELSRWSWPSGGGFNGRTEAGDWAVLAPDTRTMGLINVRTGEGIALDALLGGGKFYGTSLTPDGSMLTVITDHGVALIATANPTEVEWVNKIERDPISGAGTFGYMNSAGDRFTLWVPVGSGIDRRLLLGRTGESTLQDTGHVVHYAIPVGEHTLITQDQGSSLLTPEGHLEPLPIDIQGLSVTWHGEPAYSDTTAVVIDGGYEQFLVDVEQPTSIIRLGNSDAVRPVFRRDDPGVPLVLVPESVPGEPATEVIVADADGTQQVPVDPYDPQTAIRLAGRHLLLGQSPATAAVVVDVTTGSVVSAHPGRVVRTFAPEEVTRRVLPDRSAVLVEGTRRGSWVVPLDGGPAINLGMVDAIGWATAPG